MFLIYVLIFINFGGNALAEFSQEKLEREFMLDMTNQGDEFTETINNLKREAKTAICQNLFQTIRSRGLKIFLNKQAFYYNESLQLNIELTLKEIQIPGSDSWKQPVLPCYGRHEIIRTSWEVDDYYDKFYYIISNHNKKMYLFEKEVLGETNTVYVVDVFKVNIENIYDIPSIKVSQNECKNESYLSTVETTTTGLVQVESAFVRDLVANLDPFFDPFTQMSQGCLLTVCLSIFNEFKYASSGFRIDREAMLDSDYLPETKFAFFFTASQRDGHELITYPCRGWHHDDLLSASLTMWHKYSLVAGRRRNSIFLLEMINFGAAVKPIALVENFDFENLQASTPSETEVYSDTNELLQALKATVPVH